LTYHSIQEKVQEVPGISAKQPNYALVTFEKGKNGRRYFVNFNILKKTYLKALATTVDKWHHHALLQRNIVKNLVYEHAGLDVVQAALDTHTRLG
jgi:hypothetical protein